MFIFGNTEEKAARKTVAAVVESVISRAVNTINSVRGRSSLA